MPSRRIARRFSAWCFVRRRPSQVGRVDVKVPPTVGPITEQTLAGDELDWLPTDDELRVAAAGGPVLPARDQPVQRSGRDKTDRAARRHRRRRFWPGQPPGGRRAGCSARWWPGSPARASDSCPTSAGAGAGCRGLQGVLLPFPGPGHGRRVWGCELSTLDSAFLLAGALTCAAYFDRDTGTEAEVRRLADDLYRRADWDWARDGGPTVTHGWRPETGFIPHRYRGYDEGLLLYVLGLGSPTHPLPRESYPAYCATYRWQEIYGRELLYSGPLFTHQLSHLWVDFRGIRDAFMRDHDSDYFENTRQATFVQQCTQSNPMQWAGYGEHCWGFTACDQPGG